MKNYSYSWNLQVSKKSAVVILTAILLLSGFFVANNALAVGEGVTITPASGGASIYIDTTSDASCVGANCGTFTELNGPTISETTAGSIIAGSHTITLPLGWEFDTTKTVTVFSTAGDILPASQVVTPGINSLTFTVSQSSTQVSSLAFMFNRLNIRPTGTIPSSGPMTYSGAGMGVINGNWGTITTVAGTVTKVVFETQPGGAIYGSLLSPQPVVKTQDQFGNNSTSGLGSTETITLTLIGDGTLSHTASLNIGTSGGNGTVTFTDLAVDTVGTGKQLVATPTTLASATSNTFDITPASLTITADAQTKVYGEANPALTASYAGLVGGDTPAVVSGLSLIALADATTPVGDIAITPSGATATNYVISFVPGVLTITPAPLTITADAQTKVYGDSDPVLTYTNTVLVGSDSISGVLSRTVGEDVGTHAITVGSVSAGSNYNVTYVGANLTITARPITVTAVTNTKIYDGLATAIGIPTITSGTLATGDAATYSETYDTATVGTGKTLTPSVIIKNGSNVDVTANYDVTLVLDTTGVITQAPLTITAENKNKVYGTANPTLTASYSGFVNGETSAVLDTPVTLFTAAVDTTDVGTSAITASAATDVNYSITFVPGVLTITQAPLTISFTTDANKTYDGTNGADIKRDASLTLGGVISSDIVTVIGGTATFADKNIGLARTVTATGFTLDGVDKDNYSIGTINTTTGNVNARAITVTAKTDTKTYDSLATSDEAPIITSTFSPAIATVDTAIFTQAYDTKNVGTEKTLAPSGLVNDGNSGNNYAVTLTPVSTGEITTVTLTATVTVSNKVVNGDNSATITGVSFDGAVEGETITPDFSGATATFTDPGGADVGNGKAVTASGITIGSGNELGNYFYDGTATGIGNILPIPTVVYVDDSWTGTTLWADPDSTGPATAFGYDAFSTIQNGINAVNNNGTVNVAAGIYSENITVDKSLTLSGASSATVTVNALSSATSVFNVTVNDVEISGFTISGATGGGQAGIFIGAGVASNNIHDNILTSNFDGIWLGSGSNHNALTANTLNNNYQGFELYHSDYNTFTKNIANLNSQYGFKIESSDYNTFGSSDIADANDASSNGKYGFYLSAGSSDSDHNTFTKNTANLNTEYGMRMNSSDGNTLTSNIFNLNTIAGIRLKDDVINLTLNGNSFTNSGIGIDVASGVGEVTSWTVGNNNISGNTTNVSNGGTGTLNAPNNWWGTAYKPTIQSKISGSVTFEPYYVDAAMTTLSDDPVSIVSVDDNYIDGPIPGYIYGYSAFSKIQEGIDKVAASGTVNVAAGTYTESLTVNKTLSLIGAGATSIISPAVDTDGITVTVNDVLIQDVKVTTSNSGTTPNKAISVEEADNLEINSVTVETTGNKAMGIWIGGSNNSLSPVSGLAIINSNITINSEATGIYADHSTPAHSGWTIGGSVENANTVIAELGNPIELYDVTASEVSHNTITTSAAGGSAVIWSSELSDLSSIVFNDNTVNYSGGSQVAILADFIGVAPVTSVATVTISGNTFSNWGSRALRIGSGATSVTVSGNKFIVGAIVEVLKNEDAVVTVNAEGNWWGQETGPAEGAITGAGSVDYRPWCTNDTCSPVDTILPIVTVDTLLTNDTTPTVTGTVVESNDVTVIVTVNGNDYTAVVTGGSWSAEVTEVLAEGTYNVTATAEDLAGNIGTDITNNELTIDTSAPTVSSLAKDHADTIVRDADTVVITATFNEAMTSAPTISIGTIIPAVAMTNDSGNVWTYSWNVPSGNDGSVVVTVAGSDTAGNAYVGTDNLTFTIDNTAPVVAITQPAVDSRVNSAKVITFTDDGAAPECSINNSTWIACVSGTTTLGGVTGFGALTDGSLTLYLRDIDVADNSGTTQVALIKDTTAPSITSKTPSDSAVGIDPTTNITVVFDEDVVITDAQVTLQKGSNPVVSTSVTFVPETKTATIDPSVTLVDNSTYTVTLTGVTDTVGNTLLTTEWIFTTSASYSMTLTTGWNLISLPVVPTNKNISSVLGATLDSAAKIETVWEYDPIDGIWRAYHPGSSGTSDPLFVTMTAGEGYWINYIASGSGTIAGTGNLFQAGDSTPPQKTLAAGWNLIGYYQLENVINTTATKAVSTVAGQWTQLRTYDNTAKQFQAVTGGNYMKPGEGYWIFMKSSSYAPYLYGPGDTD